MTNVMGKILARQKILAFLKKQNIATALEISAALHVTSANVRHHLAMLARDGRVEVTGRRSAGARGRPQKVYRLGKALLGDNLAGLTQALLEQVPPGQVEDTLQAVGRALAGAPAGGSSTALMRRLAMAVERLNAANYHARWEAHASGPRIVLGHCPYAAVIGCHPELCRVDATLLVTLLGVDVEQIARLEQTELGNIYCAFKPLLS